MKLQQGSIEAQKEVAIARAQAEMEGKIRQERENEDIAIRRMQLQAEQEKSKVRGWWRWLDPSRAALTVCNLPPVLSCTCRCARPLK